MRDAEALLRSALIRLAGGAADAACREAHSEAWASVTFTGARHRFTLWLTGADAAGRAERIQEGLGETEFALPGHLVADILVSARRTLAERSELEIEALTVEAA